jgi:hypothetical protein
VPESPFQWANNSIDSSKFYTSFPVLSFMFRESKGKKFKYYHYF